MTGRVISGSDLIGAKLNDRESVPAGDCFVTRAVTGNKLQIQVAIFRFSAINFACYMKTGKTTRIAGKVRSECSDLPRLPDSASFISAALAIWQGISPVMQPCVPGLRRSLSLSLSLPQTSEEEEKRENCRD